MMIRNSYNCLALCPIKLPFSSFFILYAFSFFKAIHVQYSKYDEVQLLLQVTWPLSLCDFTDNPI